VHNPPSRRQNLAVSNNNNFQKPTIKITSMEYYCKIHNKNRIIKYIENNCNNFTYDGGILICSEKGIFGIGMDLAEHI